MTTVPPLPPAAGILPPSSAPAGSSLPPPPIPAAASLPPLPRPSPPTNRPSRDRAVELVGEGVVARLEQADLQVYGPALTVDETASLLSLHEWTVRQLVKRGALAAGRSGRILRFDRDAVLAWLRGAGPVVPGSTRGQGRGSRARTE